MRKFFILITLFLSITQFGLGQTADTIFVAKKGLAPTKFVVNQAPGQINIDIEFQQEVVYGVVGLIDPMGHETKISKFSGKSFKDEVTVNRLIPGGYFIRITLPGGVNFTEGFKVD